MWWPFKRKALPIPQYIPPKVEPQYLPGTQAGIEVEEESWPLGPDLEAMSRTGQFRAWVSSKVQGKREGS